MLVCGIETHVCILQTALDLLAAGFFAYVPVDAVGSRNAVDRDTALRRMESAGVVLTTTEATLFEWCGTAGAAVHLVDIATGDYRESQLADLYEAARIVDCLDNVHFFQRTLVPRDIADPTDMDINTLYACLAGTSKHVGTSFTSVSRAEMAEAEDFALNQSPYPDPAALLEDVYAEWIEGKYGLEPIKR